MMCLASPTPILTSSDPLASDLAGKKGWYLGLVSHEQVVTSSITVFGTTTFSTHTPVPTTPGCISNLGKARVQRCVQERRDAERHHQPLQLISGGGLPPSPVAGMVTLDDGSTVPF
jgi:type IV pilus assembly protein PilY1